MVEIKNRGSGKRICAMCPLDLHACILSMSSINHQTNTVESIQQSMYCCCLSYVYEKATQLVFIHSEFNYLIYPIKSHNKSKRKQNIGTVKNRQQQTCDLSCTIYKCYFRGSFEGGKLCMCQ